MNILKILVVDDEPGIRSGVSRILTRFTVDYPFMDEQIGFEVLEADSGEAGLAIIEREPVDVVLLDNKLPGIQGIDLLKLIKEKQPDTLVTMITSHASLDVAIKATSIGAHDFVPKPFTPQELKSSIENITKHLFLKRMTSKLQKEGKQIRFQFLQVLSHELKAPLNAVEGYLQMITNRQFGSSIEDYQEITQRAAERLKGMRNLIMDLLDLTRFETGKTPSVPQQVDIRALATAAVDLHKPYAIQKDVDIHLHTDCEVCLYGVPDELEIIFNNLISNAVKYNKKGGRVDITICCDGRAVTMEFKDTGIGIPEDARKNLFTEFFRIKTAETKGIQGSGLGLSIVKKIVDIYKGSIEVESTPGEGSTFTLTLPLPAAVKD
ncbi:MAG TPA: hybrid sensor histidine kinase/response regulator [Bacteroidales bacterium]|nr:hybrid sensor histidine kinase/response regulator [Bacteroidales bacterium]HRZ48223.1 hybrid sensor histidine kinase/response regulator [Bacteroidales bacterium]